MIIMLDRAVPVRNGPSAIDYIRIESLDEFRSVAADADLIWAVDLSKHGNQAIMYGEDALRSVIASNCPRPIRMVAFGIDFRTDQVEHLLSAIIIVKGHAEWNSEKITAKAMRSNIKSFAEGAGSFLTVGGDGIRRAGRWGMGSKGGGEPS